MAFSRSGMTLLRRLSMGVALMSAVALLLPRPAAAQAAPTLTAGRQVVAEFLGRMARITGRQQGSGTGQTGYAFVVGTRPAPEGGVRLLLVTADHLVRDPAAPDKPPTVSLVMYSNLALPLKAQVLAEHLSPDQGDVALLLTEEALEARLPPGRIGNSIGLLPGSPAWEIGRPGTWEMPDNPGQFSLRVAAGWLLFDGLDAQRGSAGGPVLSSQGLIGMVVAESAGPAAPVRAVPVELIMAKLVEWGIKTDLVAPPGQPAGVAGGLASLNQLGAGGDRLTAAMPRPADVPVDRGGVAARQTTAAALPPMPGLVQLLSSEAVARGSWVPAGARVSPLPSTRLAVLSTPRRDAARLASLPAGFALPPDVWASGAYTVVNKLDGGAWFLIAADGQTLGYASGGEVIELWPAPAAPPAGRVVREWMLTGERRAVLRDAGTHYDLTVSLLCAQVECEQVSVFTPRAPAAGAIVPAYQVPAVSGHWQRDQVVELHVLLPRRVVETKGTQVIGCIGRDVDDCVAQVLIGG